MTALGHLSTFATPLRHVWNATVTRSPRAKHDDQVDSLTQAITWMHGATQAVSDR